MQVSIDALVSGTFSEYDKEYKTMLKRLMMPFLVPNAGFIRINAFVLYLKTYKNTPGWLRWTLRSPSQMAVIL